MANAMSVEKRVYAPGYPALVQAEGWRVVVSPNGKEFHFQTERKNGMFSTRNRANGRAGLLERVGALLSASEVEQISAGLPERPQEVHRPWADLEREAHERAWAERLASDDCSGIVAQSEVGRVVLANGINGDGPFWFVQLRRFRRWSTVRCCASVDQLPAAITAKGSVRGCRVLVDAELSAWAEAQSAAGARSGATEAQAAARAVQRLETTEADQAGRKTASPSKSKR